MRPLRLVVQAFGPYADVQIFDFRDLGHHTFFLIHGDTGSGKTTILDAICYALYGDSSGGERTGFQLRSHHAPLTRPTSVSFDFAIGSQHYRVTRSPEYERVSKRGAGTVTEPQAARLWLRNGCVDEREPGNILAERWEKVNHEIIKLLGFECNQFRQVVMLPQGQFRDFLIAPSDEREAILSVLFKTSEFREIERALKEAASTIARDRKFEGQRLSDLLQQAAVKDTAALQEERARREMELGTLRGTIEALRAQAAEAQRQLQEGQEAERKLNERDQAAQRLAELELQRTHVDAQRLELDHGRRAAALADMEGAVEQRLAEARDGKIERDLARGRYDVAVTDRERAREILIQAEQREPEIDTARQRLTQLHELEQRVGEVEEARRTSRGAEERLQALTQQRFDLQSALDEAEAALQTCDQLLETSREVAAHYEARTLRSQHLSRIYKDRAHLEEVSRDRTTAEHAAQDATETHAQLEAMYEEAQQQLELVEHAWYAGQAGVLALKLASNSPCPVCGSHDHPVPAIRAPDVPTDAVLKHQRDALRKQEKQRQEALQLLADKQRALAEVRAAHSALTTTLGDQHEAALEALRAALRTANLEMKAAQEAQAALPELERSQKVTLSKVAQCKETLAAHVGARSTAATDVETARAILTERERSIPEPLRTRTALNATKAAVEGALKQLIAGLEQARTRATEAEAGVAAAESTWLARVETADQAQQRANEYQLAFVERLGGQGFADRETYHAAKRPAKMLAELETIISTYDRDVVVATDRLSNTTRATEGLATPNTEELASMTDRSRRAHEDALQRTAALGEQLFQYAAWCDEAEKLSATIEQLQQRYDVMGEVARIANGDNPYRMSFRRFVLAALLDEVLANASHRLQFMSRGRYTLQRALGQLDRRSAGGLELEVLDLFTGRTRLAKTLSGGESFLASLALALGLADVVQARTGGIHLETMFVDEGFGSLDERTLDQAVYTLSELQQGGRLVGIISHVTELQRRIAARLEVHTSPSGSTASFVIGSAS